MKTFILIIIATILSFSTLFSQDCGSITESCVTSSITDMSVKGDAIEISLKVALSEDCNNQAVSHVSIGLPNGVSAMTPSETDNYRSDLTDISYEVENMATNPFHSIKFNTIGDEGIKPGEEEVFIFTIPMGTELSIMPVEIKRGNNSQIVSIEISAECLNALPVELVNFEGRESGKEVSLSWTTASEENSSHFEIQKSINGIDWEVIGEVKSNGNSVEMNYYVFNDERPSKGNNYYRLRMVDLDVTFEYSETVGVRVETASETELAEVTIFPNPTVDYLTIDFKGTVNSELNIRVMNVSGNILYTSKGSENSNIDVSQFATGTYFLVIDNGIDLQTQRFIKAEK